MRWDDLRESSNVEDARGSTGGGGRGLKLGIGGTLLALVASYFLGIDPRVILGLVSSVPNQQAAPAAVQGTPSDEQGRFIAAVLGGTEDTWSAIFQQNGLHLRAAQARALPRPDAHRLRLRQLLPPAPSTARSTARCISTCPSSSSSRSSSRPRASSRRPTWSPTRSGHHVQNLLGIADKVRAVQQRGSEEQAQPAVGAAGTAGGLFRRRLGEAHRPEQAHPRGRRCGLGDARRRLGRGRHDPEAHAWLRRSRSPSPTAAPRSERPGSSAG